MVLDTGSGKTRIAAEVIKTLLAADGSGGQGRWQVAVFLAPTNPLVEQVRRKSFPACCVAS